MVGNKAAKELELLRRDLASAGLSDVTRRLLLARVVQLEKRSKKSAPPLEPAAPVPSTSAAALAHPSPSLAVDNAGRTTRQATAAARKRTPFASIDNLPPPPKKQKFDMSATTENVALKLKVDRRLAATRAERARHFPALMSLKHPTHTAKSEIRAFDDHWRKHHLVFEDSRYRIYIRQ